MLMLFGFLQKNQNYSHHTKISKHMEIAAKKIAQIEVKLSQLESDMANKEANIEDIEVKVNAMQMENSGIDAGGMQWPVKRVRETFVGFFVDQFEHTFWMSSPVVPVNDPTLLFANAGMNQFKPLFLGTCDPAQEMASLTRAVNSQKCIRAGGKHNDLDDVGKDVYHHTFFEMLGTWSFGNYFKKEAIEMAWQCLTVEFGLPADRLYVTYFGGDEKQNLPVDLESKQLWEQFLPADRVLPFGCKENFWEMGNVGPCGPCSEIHFDRIGNRDARHLVNADVADVMEIWNLVFMQFNREADSSLRPLPAQHVDTGMGLERLTSILQNVDSNYDTDIFVPIFDSIRDICGCRPYTGKIGAEDTDRVDMAYRVVADHIRSLTFAISDGGIPSNDGRGYVLRRILRRAVRYGQEILNAPAGFFTRLVPVVVTLFNEAFPNLRPSQELIMSIIQEEESSFNRTLDQGVKQFKKIVAATVADNSKVVPAKDAHLLFSSMGFPLDLTQLMAEEQGLTVDSAGFEELMENDRRISAMAAKKIEGGRDLSMAAEQTAWLTEKGIDTTETADKYVWHISPTAEVKALYEGKGEGSGFTDSITTANDTFGVILNTTSFYYESGGQIFDTGKLIVKSVSGAADVTLKVTNCQVYGGYVVHICEVDGSTPVSVRVGDTVECQVDYDRRGYVAPNHTMTHVLNYAIRKVLMGDADMDAVSAKGTCDQKGSLVDADKARFDFLWNGALSAQEIKEVETIVNQQIASAVPVYAKNVPLADAKKICSLRSVFGERYPDPVRVLSVGVDVDVLISQPDNTEWKNHSVEFCGGTHLTNTSQAEDFVIIEESGIAKGIRRIVGLTRKGAAQARANAADILRRLGEMKDMAAGPELNALSKLMKQEVHKTSFCERKDN
jgi:alanyl-tRNA synthetase